MVVGAGENRRRAAAHRQDQHLSTLSNRHLPARPQPSLQALAHPWHSTTPPPLHHPPSPSIHHTHAAAAHSSKVELRRCSSSGRAMPVPMSATHSCSASRGGSASPPAERSVKATVRLSGLHVT